MSYEKWTQGNPVESHFTISLVRYKTDHSEPHVRADKICIPHHLKYNIPIAYQYEKKIFVINDNLSSNIYIL